MYTTRTLHNSIARYLLLYLAGLEYQKKSQREHPALLQACRAGDVEKAQNILEEHLRSAFTHLVRFLNQPAKGQRRR